MRRVTFSILVCGMLLASSVTAQMFTNVTIPAGLGGVSGLGSGAAFGDFYPPFDAEHNDLIISTNDHHYLFANDGDGTFTNVTSGLPASTVARAMCWGDYNNDSYLDLLSVGSPNLFENNGDGTFTDVTSAAGIASSGASKPLFVDYNNDGDLDIFFVGSPCRLFENNGDETFTDVTGAVGLFGGAQWSGICLDYDLDGYQDIYILDPPNCRLFHNNGGTSFTEVGAAMGVQNTGWNAYGVDSGDYNNDGYPDIYLSNLGPGPPVWPQSNRLYRNDSGSGFTDVAPSAGVTDIGDGRLGYFVDYNNDGYFDIFSANHVNPNRLYRNNNNGTFTDVAVAMGLEAGFMGGLWDSFGNAWGDYNYDGAIDVYLSTHFNKVLMRDHECPGNYLIIRLEGVDSNKSAVGARVRIKADGFNRYDVVRSGAGLNGADDLPLEFGLGTATTADEIEVEWPSGTNELIENIPVNQHITIVEGQGITVSADDINGFSADRLSSGVMLAWQSNLPAQFNLWRSGFPQHNNNHTVYASDRGWTKLNQLPIHGNGASRFMDGTAKRDKQYKYRLDVLEADDWQLVDYCQSDVLTKAYQLSLNCYPNPIVGSASIQLSVASAGNYRIQVYDLSGRMIDTLSEGHLDAGEHSLDWDVSHKSLASGIYHVSVVGERTHITKAVVIANK